MRGPERVRPLLYPAPMWIWMLSIFCLLLGASLLLGESSVLWSGIGFGRRLELALREAVDRFHELQETLEAGLLPAQVQWDKLLQLHPPWGELSYRSLQQLRSQGGAVLPTLRRLRALAEAHLEALQEARARASHARAQAWVCMGLVPISGGVLSFLLPGVAEEPVKWTLACVAALGGSGVGAIWLLRLAEVARWGGLRPDSRSWVLAAQCAGERFLAWVRAGTPPDLAWIQAAESLCPEAPGLAAQWGSSVWDSPSQMARCAAESLILRAGASMRKAVQVSLMEGRPCTERVEAVLSALRQDLRIQVTRELALLSTRALRPLFFCVAPSLFGLFIFAFYLSWRGVGGFSI